jgi:hypothetical protein
MEAIWFIRRIKEAETACNDMEFVRRLYSNAGLTCPAHPKLRLASLGNGWGILDGQNGTLLHRIPT